MISERIRESDLKVLNRKQITVAYWLNKGLDPKKIGEQKRLEFQKVVPGDINPSALSY